MLLPHTDIHVRAALLDLYLLTRHLIMDMDRRQEVRVAALLERIQLFPVLRIREVAELAALIKLLLLAERPLIVRNGSEGDLGGVDVVELAEDAEVRLAVVSAAEELREFLVRLVPLRELLAELLHPVQALLLALDLVVNGVEVRLLELLLALGEIPDVVGEE